MGEHKTTKMVKGCPWCGARAEVWGEEVTQIDPDGKQHPKATEWFIVCEHKIACIGGWRLPWEMPRFASKEKAIKNWNKRVGDDMLIVAAAITADIAKEELQNLLGEHEGDAAYADGWNAACDYIKKRIGTLTAECDK